jgi:hypothetical protein
MIVIFLGGLTSFLTAALLLYLEAGGGDPIFTITILKFVPAGAVLTGFAAALGYLVGALAMRLRPTFSLLGAMFIISAGVVYLVQSGEFGLFMGGPDYGWHVTRNVKSFNRFLGKSLLHSPVRLWSSDDEVEDQAISAFFAPGKSASAPVMSRTGDSAADGIGEGVSGMMATQDVSQTAAGQHLNQMGQSVQSLGSKVKTHGHEWFLLAMQTLGFATGGVVVFFQLRPLPYCKDCMLLLKRKGERTRYFSRSREMRNAVDEVLMRARDKQVQQSVHAHVAKGADKGGNWTEFSSTMEIRRCTGCRVHRINFRAARKEGEKWKPIEMFDFTTTTLEPVNFS